MIERDDHIIRAVESLEESYEAVRELLGSAFDSATSDIRGYLLTLMNEQDLSALAAGGVLLKRLRSTGKLSAWDREIVLASVYSLYLPRGSVDPPGGPIAPIGAVCRN